jgi:hypothetical protein
VRERVVQQRQRIRQHGSGTEPLQHAAEIEKERGRGEGAGERCCAKKRDTQLKATLYPQPIAQSAGREHRHGKGQRVRVHHPLQGANTCRELLRHARQRDIDDGDIELRDKKSQTRDEYHENETRPCRGFRGVLLSAGWHGCE